MNIWIEWDPAAGNAKPIKADNNGFDYVTIRRRDGFTFPKRMSMIDWTHQNMPSDVVAYCLDYVPPESVAALRSLEARLEQIGDCGDGDCKVHIRPRMHTNGGCRCLKDPLKAQQVVHAYKQYVKETT
jgi:hypothetical protein